MIQVKSGRARLRPGDREVLKRWAQAYGGVAEVWYFGRRIGTRVEVIHDATTEP
jgi:hypothetical protein